MGNPAFAPDCIRIDPPLLEAPTEDTLKYVNGSRKWIDLARMLMEEEVLIGERNSPVKLKQLHEKGLAVTEERNGEFIAFAALWPITESLYELGSIWVHPAERGRGLASKVFEECLERAANENVTVFLVTREPRIMHLAQKAGWTEATREVWGKIVSFVVDDCCSSCECTGSDLLKHCPFKTVREECHMFFVEPR